MSKRQVSVNQFEIMIRKRRGNMVSEFTIRVRTHPQTTTDRLPQTTDRQTLRITVRGYCEPDTQLRPNFRIHRITATDTTFTSLTRVLFYSLKDDRKVVPRTNPKTSATAACLIASTTATTTTPMAQSLVTKHRFERRACLLLVARVILTIGEESVSSVRRCACLSPGAVASPSEAVSRQPLGLIDKRETDRASRCIPISPPLSLTLGPRQA